MSATVVGLTPAILVISRDVTAVFVRLSVHKDILGGVVPDVDPTIGDSGRLVEAMDVSWFTTMLLALVGIPIHSLINCDRTTSSGLLL